MATVTVHMDGVAAKLKRIANNTSLGIYAANEAKSGMDKYVPEYTGDLKRSAIASPWHVTYTMGYASEPYNGHGRIHTDRNPFATSHWDRAWSASSMDEFCASLSRYLKGM